MSSLKFPHRLSAAVLAFSMVAAPLAAHADDHHDRRDGGGQYYERGDNRDNSGNVIGGALLGIGIGAILGATIAQQQQQYYAPPPPVYYAPPPPAYYAPPPGAYYSP
ncbi:MAG TPA: hypothetical protein PLT25_08335, partial [Acidocella sp.]